MPDRHFPLNQSGLERTHYFEAYQNERRRLEYPLGVVESKARYDRGEKFKFLFLMGYFFHPRTFGKPGAPGVCPSEPVDIDIPELGTLVPDPTVGTVWMIVRDVSTI